MWKAILFFSLVSTLPQGTHVWLCEGLALGVANPPKTLVDELDAHGRFDFEVKPVNSDREVNSAYALNGRLPKQENEEFANIWVDLEFTKKKLHEAHANPKQKSLQYDALDAERITSHDLQRITLTKRPRLVVFTTAGCRLSEEALREAQIAHSMIRNLGGLTIVSTIDIVKEPGLASLLGIESAPHLCFYADGSLDILHSVPYNGTDITAIEIAHWVISLEDATLQKTAGGHTASSKASTIGSPVGPVVHACVHNGSPRAELVYQLSRMRTQLPSRLTLFSIQYVDSSEAEELRVYRKQLPFDVGEEEFLSAQGAVWEPTEIMALLLEAENRKVFYGESPPQALLGTRKLFTVYASQFENLQDIASLLMEFQPRYQDRIAFHIASSSLKTAARSEVIFNHTWGGAILSDQYANLSGHQRIAHGVREAVPSAEYSLSMPFNYHSMKAFFEKWERGQRRLHIRSNRYEYSDMGSPVMELNYVQLLDLLHSPRTAPLGILYYEPESLDCQHYLKLWQTVAKDFTNQAGVKGEIIFGQINGLLNDILVFDVKKNKPAIAVYPPGSRSLKTQALYKGPPVVELLEDFLSLLAAKQGEL
ncbi:uncharacterized protein LOC34618886 [Cyclospora cayetanensis]|uniref:Protein disulfide n=2 Tax=Cyclospora cayetanensis TaxID=88456 RepID=A0A1D3D309_9EIME|nr:uncharacterized protein LOC34618886 [Cyclospora cayetanensis]OEH77834.1 protein disulfide [Cyclospora cayetanensis]